MKYNGIPAVADGTIIYASFWFRYTSSPPTTSGESIMLFEISGGAAGLECLFNTDGTLSLKDTSVVDRVGQSGALR